MWVDWTIDLNLKIYVKQSHITCKLDPNKWISPMLSCQKVYVENCSTKGPSVSGLKLILHESGGARKAARIVIKLMSILVKTADIEAWFGPFQTTEQILEELLTWLLKTYMWFSPSNNRCLCFLIGFIFTLCLIRVTRLDCWTWPPRQVSWNSRSTYQW